LIGLKNASTCMIMLGGSSGLTPLGLITPTTMKMTFTKIPVLIAESTEDEKLPIAKPRDAQDTVSKQ
jgi:hypothetical protein